MPGMRSTTGSPLRCCKSRADMSLSPALRPRITTTCITTPSLSPYTYCANSPVNIVDPNGMDWYINNENGYYTWFDGNEDKEGYTYFGKVGSALGEYEFMIDKLFKELYDARAIHFEGETPESLFTEGFSFAIRNSRTLGISGGKNNLGLLGEFLNNNGPEYSIFIQDHPFIESLKQTEHIKDAQEKIIMSSSGYLITSKEWTIFDVLNTDIHDAQQFIGSYTYYGKINDAKTQLNNIAFDSKSRTSLFYHLELLNKSRRQSTAMGNTYQVYIWKTNIK